MTHPEFRHRINLNTENTIPATAHIHFDIDYGDASIHCIIFSYQRSSTPDEFEEGTQVALPSDLSYFDPQGSCSISSRRRCSNGSE